MDPKNALDAFTYADENGKRQKLIETMAYNVNKSYLMYKESGSLDKTLSKLKLLRHKEDEPKYNV